MLHIITPAYRFNLLESIYNSIYVEDDITWHISKSNKREDIQFDFIKNDKRIKVHNIDCDDIERGKKRSEVLKHINDGFFCFLDDDTLFHENMYLMYKESEENHFKGMVIGQQILKNGKIRLEAKKPTWCETDIGNVLSHSSCLKHVFYPEKPSPYNDFYFWSFVYEYFKKDCLIWDQPISYYNKLK